MPTLDWIGKKAVEKHHKEVPFRLLEPDTALSCGPNDGADSGNLIVQGDNLHALKALLPRYAGQVKCIYIDPPYNTGNEGWAYNDNVNSPEIRKWLGEAVGKEGETLDRHDRWLCMMYPRLVLLKQFLREDGAIFVSIDDNEVATLRLMMDEIFGVAHFVASVVWRSSDNSNNDAKQFSTDHNHLVIYSRALNWRPRKAGNYEQKRSHFDNPDNDPRGPWFDGNPLNSPKPRPNLMYDLVAPNGQVVQHPKNGWRWSRSTLEEKLATGEIRFTSDGKSIKRRTYLADMEALPPSSLWIDLEETGHNRQAKSDLKAIFSELPASTLFSTPKPARFIQRILALATDQASLILDSFAGSGTTAHAVLKQNAEDGGNRRFILVEMDEHIAPNVTAERVRRVAQGYTNAKGEQVAGFGGGFQFCRLSKEPLFTAEGQIRDDVSFVDLAKFVWFSETQTGYAGRADSPLLGVHEGRAIYLLYNGILKDKSVGGGNVLTGPVLAMLPAFTGPKVIYAAANRLGARAAREGISFKQTPYSLEV
ncbi:site-specific DNA-methyltransferase [Viridibacterium curvum]|uniref:site-specific DNA-methyltransferase (adenine-specific) n=1 Tax=Viridibacterium curvum TaxID=1101404 RepID=A0ABP9QNQ5_9RHOO